MGQNIFHLVFRTKNNLKFFRQDYIRDHCEQFLCEAADRHGIGIYCMRILPDHVHLFVELPPTLSVSCAVKYLKGYSSRKFFQVYTIWRGIVRKWYKCAHLWSRWRFSRSVGSVRADIIENYILNSTHNQFSAYKDNQTKLQ